MRSISLPRFLLLLGVSGAWACGSSSSGPAPDATEADCKAFLGYTREAFRSVEIAVPQAERAAAQDPMAAAAIQTRIADALDAVAGAPARFTSPLVAELEKKHKASYATRARALRKANEGLTSGKQEPIAEAKAIDQQADQELADALREYEQRCAQATARPAASAPASGAPR